MFAVSLLGASQTTAAVNVAEYPADNPVTPAHIARTVCHAMGIHNLEAHDEFGRPYNLLADGEPLLELF